MQLKTMQRGTSPFDADFDRLVLRLLDQWHVPATSISVVDGSQTFAKGYGTAVFPNTPATADTVYYTASTTKSFTAAAVSLIIDDSKKSSNENDATKTSQNLDWDTPISSIIRDDFVLPDAYATEHITIEDALSHRTGMPDHIHHFGSDGTSVKDEVRLLRYLPMAAEIRTKFMYNNLMYDTVSHLIETVTGTDLEEYLQKRIWKPLKMQNTYWTLRAARSSSAQLASGYLWDDSTSQYAPLNPPEFSGLSGSGAMISSVADYAKWLRCMMTQSGPLSPEAHNNLVKPRSIFHFNPTIPFPEPHLYALGWRIDTYRGERIIWHTGSLTGYGSTMMYLPDRQWGLMMAGNTSITSNMMQTILYMYLLDRLLGVLPADRVDWESRLKSQVSKHRDAQLHARERLYPRLPSTPLHPAMAMEDYAGKYRNPGYGVINFYISGKALIADRVSNILGIIITMEHVSGELWTARLEAQDRDPRDYEIVRGEFRLGPEGVREIGIDLEGHMKGELIYFEKVVE